MARFIAEGKSTRKQKQVSAEIEANQDFIKEVTYVIQNPIDLNIHQSYNLVEK